MERIEKIVLIGAGNVATRMGIALKRAGRTVVQIFNRTEEPAKVLAKTLECDFSTNIGMLYPNADLYLIAVADQALGATAEKLNINTGIVAHTAGSLPLDAIRACSASTGVFYPLQTLSKHVDIDFSNVPLCIEGSDEKTLALLTELAQALSHNVRQTDSHQRIILHIAAVFACNFTNHLLHIADDILEKNGLSLDLLQPLIHETIRKARYHKPSHVQTGPAARNDKAVIEKHINELKAFPDYQNIYNFITESIIRNTNP